MSRSSPKLGRRGSPGSETASTGQGFGFAWANRRKSWASACGRMTRLAWTLPGASPAVGPQRSRDRIRARSRLPASTAREDPKSIELSPSCSPHFYSRSDSSAKLCRSTAGGIAYGRRWGFDRRYRDRVGRLDDGRRPLRVGRRLGRCTRRRVRRRALGRARRANQPLKNRCTARCIPNRHSGSAPAPSGRRSRAAAAVEPLRGEWHGRGSVVSRGFSFMYRIWEEMS